MLEDLRRNFGTEDEDDWSRRTRRASIKGMPLRVFFLANVPIIVIVLELALVLDFLKADEVFLCPHEQLSRRT
jgi:hypothetical protein